MNQANSWWGRKNRAYISQASTKFTVNDVSWIRSGAGAGEERRLVSSVMA